MNRLYAAFWMHISHIMKHKISSEVCRFSYLAALIILVESVNSQLGYNEPCASSLRRTSTSEPNQCDQLRGLGCKNGMCRCLDDTQMHYNMTSEACQVYVFGNCSIPNSMGQLSCADPNAECSYWGECLCKEGFLPESMDKKALVSREQRCLPIYPALECDKEQLPCHFNSGMECFRGRCRCPNPVSQVFENIERRNEESPQMCMGLPGMKKGCDPKSVLENNGCRLNSHCDQNGTCQCNPGHVPTPGLNPECQLGKLFHEIFALLFSHVNWRMAKIWTFFSLSTRLRWCRGKWQLL